MRVRCVRLEAVKGTGTSNANVIASVSAAGNTKGGPVTTSGSLAANLHRLGASISKEHIPGYGTTLTKSASASVLLNKNNSLDGSVFKSNSKLANGIGFEKNGFVRWL
ncbi:attacin-A-like [Bactrocera dorsalis]|uniref:Attacin-A-like n=1 Tax=Bactrocera dorsalis TaxID=27457 RepID=A0A6J0RP11_BACDO|nr:attacin-A-like [Bactrocera dorsalis]